jgi:PmbA protein
VRLSAAELFLSVVEEDLRNSRGLTGTATSTRLLLEIALLARGDADETEFFRQAEARRLDDLAIEQTVVRGSAMARDKLQAGTPRTRLGPVVVSDEALGHLFGGTAVSSTGAFLTQASAQLAYSNISRFELGEPVYGGRPLTGDPLTLRSNARLPHGVASYRFDGDGIAAQDLLVIEDGVLRARPATQRYAHYLGIPATGRVGMVQVAPGSTSSTELLAGDGAVLEVVAFSAPNVDVLTGDFGMEIRLGYEHGPDGRRPVAGGSLTGNLFSAMAGARLSSETHQLATYAGPVAIRFDALQVAGED